MRSPIIILITILCCSLLYAMDVSKEPMVLSDKEFESVAIFIRKGWDSFVASKLAGGIISKPIPVNGCNAAGETFLHYAAGAGKHEVVALLLARGANVNASTTHGSATPLHSAIISSEYAPNIVIQLLEHDASVVFPAAISLNTPLHSAAESGFENLVKIILVKARHHIDYRLQGTDDFEEAVRLITNWRIMEGKKLLQLRNKKGFTPGEVVKFQLDVLCLRTDKLKVCDQETKEKLGRIIPLLSVDLFEMNFQNLIERDVRKILYASQKKPQ
ncbi:MAG: ankyrin repeat domain-containing protein [Candidatus Babeliales bacterium]